MQTKLMEKVTALRPAPNRDQEYRYLAEVIGSDEPSSDAKAWYQRRLANDKDRWRACGELMREAAEMALMGSGFGFAVMESVKVGAERLKTDLGYEKASPLERLVIENAILCHLRLSMIEHLYSRQVKGSYQMNVAAHWELRLTLAQRRYLKVITSLARVRGLLARASLAEASLEAKQHVQGLRSRKLMRVAS